MNRPQVNESRSAVWYLEGFEGQGRKILRAAVRSLPFSVGRRSSCDLVLDSRMVSQHHAELFEREDGLWVRDLGSTNGTFVNGQRVGTVHRLRPGDIIHFADLEYRLVEPESESSEPSLSQTLRMTKSDLLGMGPARHRELREMLQKRQVEAYFQPLVHLVDADILGYEVLGRGILDGVATSPGELFVMAEVINKATELSTLFRIRGLEDAGKLPAPCKVFVNTHPSELHDGASLLASLAELRNGHPQHDIVLEIHESAVTDLVTLRGLRRDLDRLGIGVAFDDFGTGQARLLELTDAAPHYLKFDVALIKNIHLASQQRRDMVQTLVRLVLDMGIVAIAEGIELPEEAEVCLDIGFQYGQGYHFGRPAPAAFYVAKV